MPVSDGLVAVLARDGTPVGAGCLITTGFVATCAHVIAKALGHENTPSDPPADLLDLIFPFLEPDRRYPGKIVTWWPEAPSGAPNGCRDIAILRLDRTPPKAQTIISTIDWMPETSYKTYGFPRAEGHWAHGTLREARADGWIQISGDTGFTYRIEQGFSGAPIIVEIEGIERVVGIAAVFEPSDSEHEAFAIPMAYLKHALDCAKLPQGDPKIELLKSAVADVQASFDEHRLNNPQLVGKVKRDLHNLNRTLGHLATYHPAQGLDRLSVGLRALYQIKWQLIGSVLFQPIDLTALIERLKRLGAKAEQLPKDQAGHILNDMRDEPEHLDLIQQMLREIESLEMVIERGVSKLDAEEKRRLLDVLGDLASELWYDRIDPNRLVQLRSDLEAIRSAINLLQHLFSLHETFLGENVSLLPHGAIFRDRIEAPPVVVIRSGKFLMGSPTDEEGRRDDEGPQREVSFAYRFAVGRYPVTFDEYDRFTDETGRERVDDWEWGRGRLPVVAVDSQEASDYLAWLSERTGHPYRLLSEAEWEYACRAGSTTRYWWGDKITPANANYAASEIRKTTVVGSYRANPWGLCDMHGNVWEWLQDSYHESYEGAPIDGSAWTSGGGNTETRGGSWHDTPDQLRAARRANDGFATDRFHEGLRFGFRIARTLPPLENVGS